MSKLGKTIEEIFDSVVDEETVDGKISQALEDAKEYTDEELSSLKIVAVDDKLSTDSTNPVQNKAITNAINGLDERIDSLENSSGEIIANNATEDFEIVVYIYRESDKTIRLNGLPKGVTVNWGDGELYKVTETDATNGYITHTYDVSHEYRIAIFGLADSVLGGGGSRPVIPHDFAQDNSIKYKIRSVRIVNTNLEIGYASFKGCTSATVEIDSPIPASCWYYSWAGKESGTGNNDYSDALAGVRRIIVPRSALDQYKEWWGKHSWVNIVDAYGTYLEDRNVITLTSLHIFNSVSELPELGENDGGKIYLVQEGDKVAAYLWKVLSGSRRWVFQSYLKEHALYTIAEKDTVYGWEKGIYQYNFTTQEQQARQRQKARQLAGVATVEEEIEEQAEETSTHNFVNVVPDNTSVLILGAKITSTDNLAISIMKTCGAHTIDWGDGTIDRWLEYTFATHEYDSVGDYEIKLYGLTELDESMFSESLRLSMSYAIIPNGISKVPSSSFAGCTALTDVILPSIVTEIGDYAFDGCTSLANCELPKGLKSIGAYAFRGTAIKYINIPHSVTRLGDCAFANMNAWVDEVTIGAGITDVGDYVFSNTRVAIVRAYFWHTDDMTDALNSWFATIVDGQLVGYERPGEFIIYGGWLSDWIEYDHIFNDALTAPFDTQRQFNYEMQLLGVQEGDTILTEDTLQMYLADYVKDGEEGWGTQTKPGILQFNPNKGIGRANKSPTLELVPATTDEIDKKNDTSYASRNYKPICPGTLDYAVKTSLVSNKYTLTTDEKSYIRYWLGIGEGGGLTEREIDEKIENALTEASLSLNQWDQVFEMIETNVPMHLEANMEGYLVNAGAILLNGSAWLETQDKIQALENQKLFRVTGTAFEQFYGDDGQGKECRFECVCRFPNNWAQDFLHTLYDSVLNHAGVISLRLLPPADNSFYPLHDTYNSDNDMSTLVGFNTDGTFYGGATLSGTAFNVVVSVKDVVVKEIPAIDN
jgi:hypothetical protein